MAPSQFGPQRHSSAFDLRRQWPQGFGSLPSCEPMNCLISPLTPVSIKKHPTLALKRHNLFPEPQRDGNQN